MVASGIRGRAPMHSAGSRSSGSALPTPRPDPARPLRRLADLRIQVDAPLTSSSMVRTLLAFSLILCACTTANTPQQNLAYERWAKCRSPFVQLERVDLDGRITFRFSDASGRQEVLECLAEADRVGPPLLERRAVGLPGGP